jgi:hypothetical protein
MVTILISNNNSKKYSNHYPIAINKSSILLTIIIQIQITTIIISIINHLIKIINHINYQYFI